MDPLVDAAKNIGQYIIEEVRDHRFVTGERRILKNVILNIKWLGYEEPTEEIIGSNDTLISNVRILEYMNGIPMLKKLIPKRFRNDPPMI